MIINFFKGISTTQSNFFIIRYQFKVKHLYLMIISTTLIQNIIYQI